MKNKDVISFWAFWKPVSDAEVITNRRRKSLDIWLLKKIEMNKNFLNMKKSCKPS